MTIANQSKSMPKIQNDEQISQKACQKYRMTIANQSHKKATNFGCIAKIQMA